jgi:hypothetical protein
VHLNKNNWNWLLPWFEKPMYWPSKQNKWIMVHFNVITTDLVLNSIQCNALQYGHPNRALDFRTSVSLLNNVGQWSKVIFRLSANQSFSHHCKTIL